jgi:hypothetical protein
MAHQGIGIIDVIIAQNATDNQAMIFSLYTPL